MARSALLNVMVQAAFKAGKSARARFRRSAEPAGLAEGAGRLRLAGRPQGGKDHPRGADEGPPDLRLPRRRSEEIAGTDGAHRWIVDPLDGTTSFLHGIPCFAVSIALERNGEIVAGVVLNPATDELFTAERGGEASNDRRLRVAACESFGCRHRLRHAASRPR